jgi:hypothetical protein
MISDLGGIQVTEISQHFDVFVATKLIRSPKLL